MSTMTEVPHSTEVEWEEAKARSDFQQVLEEAGIDVASVFRAWYPARSDRTIFHRGQFEPAALVIFLDSKDKPRTALVIDDGVGGRPVIQVSSGWHGANVEKRR